MPRRFCVFLIVLVLWLPVQAATVWAMPWECLHGMHSPLEPAKGGMPHAAHEEAEAKGGLGDRLGCQACPICHLATGGYLLAAKAFGAPLAYASAWIDRRAPARAGRAGEDIWRPPKLTS